MQLQNISRKHAGAIKDILTSRKGEETHSTCHPKVRVQRSLPSVTHGVNGKGVYHPAAILFTVLCRANGAMLRFCATPEVNEAYGTSDPATLCRDLTPNLEGCPLLDVYSGDLQEIGLPPFARSPLEDGREI